MRKKKPQQPKPIELFPSVRVSLIIICLIIAMVYLNSFAGTYIFDDGFRILENERIRSFEWPWAFLVGTSRPVLYFTLAINYSISGYETFSFHLFNLSIHLLSAILLFLIIRHTLYFDQIKERFKTNINLLSGLIVLFWSIHPLQTSSVTYIIQRAESMMGMFYLLTFYCALQYLTTQKLRWMTFAWGSCLLGSLTKQIIITAPIVIFLYERAFITGSFKEALRRNYKLYLGLIMTWGVMLFLYKSNLQHPTTSSFGYQGITPLQYALSQTSIVLHYLRLALWPQPLLLDYNWFPVHSVNEVLPALLTIIGLVIVSVWAYVRYAPAGFLAVSFFVILLPSSSFFPIKDLAFEHRMYLPLAAIMALAVTGGYELIFRLVPNCAALRKFIGMALVITLVLILGVLTFCRNRDYYTLVLMWSDVVKKRPGNARGHYNLGNALKKTGKVKEANEHYRRAILLKPDYAEAYYNLALNLGDEGRIEEAISYYRQALKLKPDSAQTHTNLGRLLIEREEEKALAHFREAVRIDPALVPAQLNLANLTARRGDRPAAISRYNLILEMAPDSDEAHYNLAVTLALEGETRSAEDHYREAIRINPEQEEAQRNLSLLLSESGKNE